MVGAIACTEKIISFDRFGSSGMYLISYEVVRNKIITTIICMQDAAAPHSSHGLHVAGSKF